MSKHNITLTSSSADGQVYLPREIIELILLSKKCPVKSVIRFKSVSKLWQSIISHPRFFRSLSRMREINDEHKFIIFPQAQRRDPCIMIVEDGRCRRESAALGYPFTYDEFHLPICSCNGLILLLRGPRHTDYVLWNPLIRKHIIIQPPCWEQNVSILDLQHHLYYDSVTEDYRIVLVNDDRYAVFSCTTGSWGETTYFPNIIMTFGAFVDGCLYTMQRGGIICFDVRDGKLHNLPLPKEVLEGGLFELRLNEVSGRLCLYGFNEDCEDHGLLLLWVMEKKKQQQQQQQSWNWRKLISMEKEKPLVRYPYPVCVTNGDDVVLRAKAKAKVNGVVKFMYKYFLYNSSRNSCNLQELISWDYYSIACFPYSENLLMPTSTSTSN